ncbi:hypothetical protein RUND412_003843 [Rhizina undulata]
MQAANRLQKTLRTGSGVAYGTWQMFPGTHLSRAIARSGFDWILVDTEHGNLEDSAMHESINAIAGCGVSPIVRVPAAEGWMVKRALDAGAHGIMVPLVSTAEEAMKVVSYSKFPPMGVRGFGSPFSMGAFGVSTAVEYLQQANESLLTVVQIETKQALENVDEIAAVEGIDVLFVGPFDLGNSIGHPITSENIHPELQAGIKKVLDAANRAGKRSGIYCTGGEQARMYVEQGFHMVAVAADTVAVESFFSASLKTARGGDSADDVEKSTGPFDR